MADPNAHLTDAPETSAPPVGPLPVCEYGTGEEEPCEEPAMQKRWSGTAVIIAAVFGAIVGGILVAAGIVWALGLLPGSPQPVRTGGQTTTSPQTITIKPDAGTSSVAEAVARKVVPSVVNVGIEQAQINPFTGQRAITAVGNGSGVIIRSDGYVLTNYHVVKDADRIVVRVGVDNKVAKVVGVDPSTDLAVISIEASGLPAIDVGSSKDLKVGQWVMAVGSPFGLEKTVTTGIISALQRSELVQGDTGNDITTYTNLIQTDAAINPGNSGGALVDERGRLVGINTLIQSPSGSVGTPQSAGIGFAIPVDFAIDIAKQLIDTGKATHPYMGVSTETIDQSTAQQLNLKVQSGALVRVVQPNSPAAAAGIQNGDVIIRIGTRSITSVEDVFGAVREHQIGQSVPVELIRNDVKLTVTVTLASDSSRR
jgi:putative serine protease PepD